MTNGGPYGKWGTHHVGRQWLGSYRMVSLRAFTTQCEKKLQSSTNITKSLENLLFYSNQPSNSHWIPSCAESNKPTPCHQIPACCD
ncbi:mCG1042890 [Mus musculus]|nr:mCG1042890 [Mus musculus]